jgi:hypothetical protein
MAEEMTRLSTKKIFLYSLVYSLSNAVAWGIVYWVFNWMLISKGDPGESFGLGLFVDGIILYFIMTWAALKYVFKPKYGFYSVTGYVLSCILLLPVMFFVFVMFRGSSLPMKSLSICYFDAMFLDRLISAFIAGVVSFYLSLRSKKLGTLVTVSEGRL